MRKEFRRSPSSRFAPYIGATAGALYVRQTSLTASERSSRWAFAASPAAGVSVSVGPSWGVRFDFKALKGTNSVWFYNISGGVFFRPGQPR